MQKIIYSAIITTLLITACKKPTDDSLCTADVPSISIDGDATNIESFNCNTLIIVNRDTQTTGDKLKLTLKTQN